MNKICSRMNLAEEVGHNDGKTDDVAAPLILPPIR